MTIGQELDAALQALQPIPGPPGPPGTSPTVDLSGLQADIKVLYSSVLDLQTRMTAAETALASGPQISPQDLLSMMGQMAADMQGLNPADLATISQEVQAIQKALQPVIPVAPDNAPVWKAVPTLTFTQGVKGFIAITPFVSDPDADPLTITLNGLLPAGCTFDGANINYDGVGLVGHSTNTMTANDGKP